MNIKHKYNYRSQRTPSSIFLAKPGRRIICALSGIDETTASLSVKTNNTAALSFSIDKYANGILNQAYDYLDEYMELYCSGIWFKIMEPPSITNDGLREIKEVTAESYEIMLTQYMLKTFLINMGTEGSYEMMYRNDHDKSKFYQVKFWNPKEEKLSLLHIILAHAEVPGWKIGYVDNITPDDQGVFLPDAICNFEVENKSVYAFLTQDVAQAYKCVFEFDTENMLINVYRPDSLGKDTNVVLGFRNIQDNITITREDSLVTQYYVEGLNGYNIEMYNFKTNVIEDLSYFVKEPYMNKELQEKYTAWTQYKDSRREEFYTLSKEYNKYLTELTELMYRVPVDSAKNNWFGRKLEDLKTAYNDNIAIIKGIEKLYVDKNNNFDLDALKKSHDWPLYESIMNYTIPAIVAAMQAKGEKVEGFGKGNVISCVNPVVMGDDWLYIGADKATFDTIQLTNAPAWGITRAIKITGTGGIRQKNISVEKTQPYTLSCYVKGSGTFNLEFGDTGQKRTERSFNITSSWQRVYFTFNPGSKLVDAAFTGTDFTVCGMQLEMGTSPSQFGYFTQSENILKAYETDWKLYGIAELKAKIATYEGCADELKKNGYAGEYNPLADYEEAYFTQMHQLYLDYLKLIKEATAALNERQKEYDGIKEKQDAVDAKRDQIVKEVSMEYFGTIQNAIKGFTPQEIYIIKSLYNQAVYTNENIIVTSLDDTVNAVDKQKKLYEDAIEQLYIESHPQFIYEDTINNIYALPEFKEYHKELQINNFVRVGLSDKKYIKLRLTEISFNPLALDESMNVTFSNMIQYRSKRDDLAYLINDAGNSSSRDGGRVTSVNKNSTTDYVIDANIIKQIFSNPLFGSIISGSTAGGSGSGGTITADKIVAELVKAEEGIFNKLTADTAFIKYLESKLIVSDKIITGILQADKAQIEELSATIIKTHGIDADIANIKNLLAGHAGIGDLTTINLTANNVTINDAVIKDMIAAKISVADLMAHSATAQLITLISANGKPTIAFKDSTQQFYDEKGNVRVQIGQDGNGKFNFIVRGEDGKTAIMDEHGIHREGIPDGTIVNNMIDGSTISKDKLNFPIVDTDENGNISITNVYDGKEQFGIKYTKFETDVNNKFTDLTNKMKRIELYSDGQVFINNNEVITPKSIKVYGLVKGDVKIAHWYIDDVEQTTNIAVDKSFIMIPHTLLSKSKTSITIKATSEDGKIYDVLSLYYVYSGVSGFNSATVYLYQRSFNPPSLPSKKLTYNFITRELTGTIDNNWKTTIPEGSEPLYVTVATASSQLTTATIEAWTTPVILSKDGEQGLAGLNVATIYLYQRSSVTPKKPTLDVTYSFKTKQTIGMNNGWETVIPNGNNPVYLTIATASSNTDEDVIHPNEWSEPTILSQNGANGEDGVGIREIIEYYQVSDSKNTPPSSWVLIPPEITNTNKYLWNYEKIVFTDNSIKETEKRIVGTYGKDGINGNDGVGVESIINSYLATSLAKGVTHTTPGWTNEVQDMTELKKYLWNYETITYTDKTEKKTIPCIIGVHGDKGQDGSDGISVIKIEEFYQVSASNSTAPVNWVSTPPTLTSTNKYLWNYEKVSYSNNTSKDTNKRIIGVYGDKGVDGKDGVGIDKIENYYLATNLSSGVTSSTSGWTSSVQIVSNEKKYLWNYEKVTYTNGQINNTDPCIIGTYAKDGKPGLDGKPGVNGIGIKVIEEFYQISNSNIDAPKTWVKTPPAMTESNKYLWNYEQITYSDGNIFETEKRVIGVHGVNGQAGVGINEVKNYYLVTSSGSGITHNTSGWTETVQLVNESKKYLWNYEQITYTDNTIHKTTPCIIGTYAKDGVDGKPGLNGIDGIGISKIEEFYQISSSNTTIPTTWVSSPPKLTPTEKYLWNYEKIIYTNNDVKETAKRVIGVYGDKGQPGTPGIDGYTVFLSNQSDSYICDTKGNIGKQIQNSTKVIVYKGVKELQPIIGDITTVPGMNITKVGNVVTFTALVGTLLPQKGSIVIPVTVEGKTFELLYSFTKVVDASGALEQLTTTVTEVESKVDLVSKEITNKVSQTVFDEKQNAINKQFSEITQNVGTIESTVSSMNTTFGEKIEANSTKITQTANKLNLIATGGDGTSSLTLTQGFIDLMSKNISIKAENINIDGLITAMNTYNKDGGKTYIDGGLIDTNTVQALLIRANSLKSQNYEKSITNSTPYSNAGTFIDMVNGSIETPNFAVKDGHAYFKGNGEFAGKITASSGYIGGVNGFVILGDTSGGKLYSGQKNVFETKHTKHGVYVGTDGISISGTNPLTGLTGGFSVDKYGNMIAKSGTFSGHIEGGTFATASGYFNVDALGQMTAKAGYIGGFTIAANSLYNGSGTFGGHGVFISPNGISCGPDFKVTADGTLTAKKGIIGDFTIQEGGLTSGYVKITPYLLKYGDNFSVNTEGNLYAANANITGNINATTGTIGGFSVSTTLNDTEHAYQNTLYRIVQGSDGYDYQAGIKAASGTNQEKEAAFYIRRKLRGEPSWKNSEIPFFVRNNGYVYANDLTVGNNFYMDGSTTIFDYETGATDYITKRYKVAEASDSDISLGYVSKGNYISFYSDMVSFSNKHTSVIDLQKIPTGSDKFEFYPSLRNADATLEPVSTRMIGRRDIYVNLGKTEAPFDTLYIRKIKLGAEDVISKWADLDKITAVKASDRLIASNDSTYIVRLQKVTDTNTGSDKLVFAPTNVNYNNLLGRRSIPWSTAYIDTLLLGNNATGYSILERDGDGKFKFNHTLITTNGNGYNTYGPSNTPRTIGYVNDKDECIFADNGCNKTYLRGQHIYIGNRKRYGSYNGQVDYYKTKLNLSNVIAYGGDISGTATYIGIDANGDLCAMSNSSSYIAGAGISIDGNIISADTNYFNNKYVAKGVFKPQDINWLNNRYNDLDYYGFGHLHTIILNSAKNRAIAITNDNIPALIPYVASNYKSADQFDLAQGKTYQTNLGNVNNHWDTLYVNNISLNGGGSISSWNYGDLTNKPQINGRTLSGNVSISTLGLAAAGHSHSGYATESYVRDYVANNSGGGTVHSSNIQWSGLKNSHSDNNGHIHRGISNSSGKGLWVNTTNVIYGAADAKGSKSDGVICLGESGNRFKEVWSTNGLNKGSDRNIKHSINKLTTNMEQAFMEFIPVSYMLKNINNEIIHDRLHYGFIAQDIENSINKYDITNQEAGFLCIDHHEQPNAYGQTTEYSLRYEEFIPLNTHMTQKAHHRIDSQEQKIQDLMNSNLLLQGEISLLKQQLQELKELINSKNI